MKTRSLIREALEARGLWSYLMEAKLRRGECPIGGCPYNDLWITREDYTGPAFTTQFLDHVQAHLLSRTHAA